MATGVKPRDEDIQLTRTDLEAIQDAMKSKKFRDLLSDYCEEIRDPANQALYQKEMTQLEKERGYDVTFLNPKGSYVIKTSVAGDRKAFINICSNENIGKPSYSVQEVNGQKGMNWQIPFSLIPPREDYDHKRQRCVIYDVIFHPDTLRMAEVNKQFRELVNKTAFDGLQNTYNIHLDSNNIRFPKSYYKGMSTPAVIRKEDPEYKAPIENENEECLPETLEKLYPQHVYSERKDESHKQIQQKRNLKMHNSEFTHLTNNGYTIPKYVIKQQKTIDFQDYTYHKDSKQYSAIPSHIVVEVNLPLLSSTKDCVLDVQEKFLSLISESPAKYKLDLPLPYLVNDQCGNAKFDKMKHMLIVTLPVIKRNVTNENKANVKIDSGIDSEENSGSHSDDDNSKQNLIEELSSTSVSSVIQNSECNKINDDTFLEPSLGYLLPSYTYNVLDETVAFTFHVKNTEPDSVKVKTNNNKIYIKFTSVGSGFVPVHYAAMIVFSEDIKFENVNGEAWDNNVILQLEITGEAPQKFQIGLSENSFKCEYFDASQLKKITEITLDPLGEQVSDNVSMPVVEVTNLGTETNIVVSSNQIDFDEDDLELSISPNNKEVTWANSMNSYSGAKSILRKSTSMTRSFSESSVGDVASSMDYISSDCIPEESSLKKTVRFNDVIARQFYRYNSSIEGQKKKNQRKKSKKRNQESRRSESEAEDDIVNLDMTSKAKLKSAIKQRHDSGLADTSDAEMECKNTPTHSIPNKNIQYCEVANEKINNNLNNVENASKSLLDIMDDNGNVRENPKSINWKSEKKPSERFQENPQTPVTCGNIKHNTDLYDPDKLNKGEYLEVTFKNDLIFDLDM